MKFFLVKPYKIWIIALIFIFCLLNVVKCSQDMKLKAWFTIQEYEHISGLLKNNKYCEGFYWVGDECDPLFKFQMTNYFTTPGKNINGSFTIGQFDNTARLSDINLLEYQLAEIPAETFLSIEIVDIDSNREELMWSGNTTFFTEKKGTTNLTFSNGTWLNLAYTLACVEDYYGAQCEVYCKAKTKYTYCNDQGRIVCRDVCGSGNCVIEENSIYCKCNDGFVGTHCNIFTSSNPKSMLVVQAENDKMSDKRVVIRYELSAYENSQGKTKSGQRCETFFWAGDACDPIFHFEITSHFNSNRSENVGHFKLGPFTNTDNLQNQFVGLDFLSEMPSTVNMSISIFDNDNNQNETIDKALTTFKTRYFGHYHSAYNSSIVNLNTTVHITCTNNYYGAKCDTFCKSAYQYTYCNEEGSLECMDVCGYGKCQIKLDRSFVCICDKGYSGSHCNLRVSNESVDLENKTNTMVQPTVSTAPTLEVSDSPAINISSNKTLEEVMKEIFLNGSAEKEINPSWKPVKQSKMIKTDQTVEKEVKYLPPKRIESFEDSIESGFSELFNLIFGNE